MISYLRLLTMRMIMNDDEEMKRVVQEVLRVHLKEQLLNPIFDLAFV